jgi:hypothetical protein
MERAPKDYCLRQILKIGHYITAVMKREILSMEAEFYMDDNGKIWFCYANNITQRKRLITDIENVAIAFN